MTSPATGGHEEMDAARATNRALTLGSVLARVSAGDLAFAVMSVLAVGVLLYLARHGIFFHDEWTIIDERRGLSIESLMTPHNEHWSLTPMLAYNALLATFGLRTYLPYLLVLMVTHVAAASAIYALMRAQNGTVPALGGAAILLFLGHGYEDLLWAWQMAFVGAAAAGAWAMFLTFVNPTRRRLMIAAVLLVLAVATAGTALFFLAGIAAALLLDRSRREELWVVAPATLVYGLWFVTFGAAGVDAHRDPFSVDSLRGLHDYLVTGMSTAIGQVSGFGPQVGLVLFVGLLGVTAWHVSGGSPLRTLAVAGLAGLLAQFIITGLVRAQFGAEQSTSPRYVYIAAMLILITASGWIGMRFASPRLRSLVVLGAFVVVALGSNAMALMAGRHTFQGFWDETRAAIMVTEQYAGSGGVPEDARIYPIPTREALALARSELGFSLDDAVLPGSAPPPPSVTELQLERLVASTITAIQVPSMPAVAEPIQVTSSIDATITSAGPCADVTPSGGDPQVVVLVPGGMAVALRAGNPGQAQVFVAFSSFQDDRSTTFATDRAAAYVVDTPDVGAGRPWLMRIDPPDGRDPTSVCLVAGMQARP